MTLKFVTNTLGNAAILVNPWCLPDTTNLLTGILLANNNANDLSGGGTGNSGVGVSQQSRLTPNTATAYRLVSACISITPEVSANNAQGYIAGGIVTRAGQNPVQVGGVSTPWGGAFTNSTAIDQALYYQKAQIGAQQCVRSIYFPFDPTFEMFVPVNTQRSTVFSGQGCDEFYWNYYITGAAGVQSFVVDIYYNFELEPNSDGVLQLMTTKHTYVDNDKAIITEINAFENLISQVSTNPLNLAEGIDSSHISGDAKSTSNLLDDTLSFIGENKDAMISIGKVAAEVLLSLMG